VPIDLKRCPICNGALNNLYLSSNSVNLHPFFCYKTQVSIFNETAIEKPTFFMEKQKYLTYFAETRFKG